MSLLDRKLLRDLLHLRGQVAAVSLVVACGAASFLTARTGYEALLASRSAYYDAYRFADLFVSVKRAPETVAARLAAIPGVGVVETRVVTEASVDVPGLDEPAAARLQSLPELGEPRLNAVHLRRGRWPEPGRRDQAVVSEAFAEANRLVPGDTVAVVLGGRWQRLHLVGVGLSPEHVYEIRAGTVLPDPRRYGVMWLRREALAHALDLSGAFNDASFRLLPGAREAEAIVAIDRVLGPWGGLGAYGRVEQTSHQLLDNELGELRVMGRVLPAVFLGVAAFLLHIVVTRLVGLERDRIAVLKAFGFSSLTVGGHYLKLVLVMLLPGAALGIALGLALGAGLNSIYGQFFRFPVLSLAASPAAIVLCLLLTVGAGAGGAMVAVRRAVRLPPAEAMRPESPAVYRRGRLERLGLYRGLGPVGKMVLRSLTRRPLRMIAAVVAVGLSVAIVFLGRYFFDAVDFMLAVQFRAVERGEVTVVLREPAGPGAIGSLRHLPGVRRIEPFRAVPVRLRAGQLSDRVGLLGLDPGAELRRVVDRHLRPVELPPDGLLLTERLARDLAVRPGDRVRVEVLEGRRPVRELAVGGVADELFGESAYLDRAALGRLLGENGTISGATLSIDPRSAADFKRRLKVIPAVSGSTFRDAALESFERTIARSFGIFTAVLVALAAVIALGVVYNGARIALSERARELASLRVLGFSRAEVGAMLLGEQAVVTLAALPVGLLAGIGAAALISLAYDTEMFRLPLVVSPASTAFALLVVLGAAALSGLVVYRRVRRLDLVAVLKTRE